MSPYHWILQSVQLSSIGTSTLPVSLCMLLATLQQLWTCLLMGMLFALNRKSTIYHIASMVETYSPDKPTRKVLYIPRTVRGIYLRAITVHCGMQYFVAEAESGVILLVSTRAFQICNQNRETKFCKSDQTQLSLILIKSTSAWLLTSRCISKCCSLRLTTVSYSCTTDRKMHCYYLLCQNYMFRYQRYRRALATDRYRETAYTE